MQRFTNNASANLTAAITNTDTSLNVSIGKGALFAALTGSDYQLATLTDGTNVEIVKITARSTDTLTVTRGYDGTTARAWTAGAVIEARLDASTLYTFPQLAPFDAISATAHATGLTLQPDRASSSHCASGANSIAVGVSAQAGGGGAIAIGHYADAAGFEAISVGDNALANYNYSISIGNAAESKAVGSVAIGTVAYAGGNSVAIGYESSGQNTGNVAIGNGATCLYDYAVAIGSTASAGWLSVVIGNSTSANYNGCVVIGNGATASQNWSTAVGQSSSATGPDTVAYGGGASASGASGLAVGHASLSSGSRSTAIGASAIARIDSTAVITGAVIVRKDDGINASDVSLYLTGAEVVYTSKEIDLKTTQTVTIDIPTGAKFYPDEIGVIVTNVASPTGQPTISFGVTGSNASLLAATATTKNAQFGRDRYTTLLSSDGVSSLTATITAAAAGTTFSGRVYFKGLLVEAQ